LKESICINGRGSNSRLGIIIFIASLPMGLSCTNRPSEIIVTTDAAHSSTIPVGAKPVSLQPNLPTRNPDLEAAGDKIAEAIVYLNSRRKDRREVAHVLDQAGVLIARAEQHSEARHRQKLHEISDNIASISKGLHRSIGDTTKQLAMINHQIDTIQEEAGSENSQSANP
jgi:hypothetical protein